MDDNKDEMWQHWSMVSKVPRRQARHGFPIVWIDDRGFRANDYPVPLTVPKDRATHPSS